MADLNQRVTDLEGEVATLREELAGARAQLGEVLELLRDPARSGAA